MMTPIYLNPPTSNSDQVKEDHDHHQHLKLFITQHQTSESSCSTFFNTTQDQNPSHDHHHSHQHEHKVYNYFWRDESSDRQVLPSSSIHPTIGDDSFGGLKSSSISKPENGGDDNNNNNTGNGLTVKWTSSKMRLMRKMMNSNRAATEKEVRVDHHHQQQQQQPSSTQINYLENGNDIIRVCSNCNTTKTPLWRGGPCGPKSLCNACGIRLRKARRAMEAAATNGTVIETMTESSSSSTTTKTNHKVINKEKKSRTNYNLAQYKKQCKLQDQECVFNNDHQSTNKRLCFEDFALNLLNKNSGFRGVFAQDEEEGAVLLMALSCGLV